MSESLAGKLNKIWGIVVVVAAGLVAYGVLTKQVDVTSAAVVEHAKSITSNTKDIAAIKQAITVLPDIQRDLKELLRRVK